jgi:hypothetical protein
LGLFPLLEGTSPDVNNKPRLGSDEKKTCVVLALTSIEYEVNRMARGHYQALPFLFGLCFMCSLLALFLCKNDN